MSSIKKEGRRFRKRDTPTVPVLTPAASTSGCSRIQGHLERVRLLQLSGKSDDYAEFKTLFQQLCGGERYPAIIIVDSVAAEDPKGRGANDCGIDITGGSLEASR